MKSTLPEPEAEWNNVSSGAHLMGGTPLSSEPRDGVVSTNLRIHNSNNVFIVSSSVFPTSGGNLPTMNIIALAIRLAKHLVKTYG